MGETSIYKEGKTEGKTLRIFEKFMRNIIFIYLKLCAHVCTYARTHTHTAGEGGGLVMLPTITIHYLTKIPLPNMRSPPFKLLVRGDQETPKAMQTVAAVLSCLPGFKDTSLLLKITFNFDTDHEGSKLDLT